MSGINDFQHKLVESIKSDLQVLEKMNRMKAKAHAEAEARRRAQQDEHEEKLRKILNRDSGYRNRQLMRQVRFGERGYKPHRMRKFTHNATRIKQYSETVPFIVPAAEWRILERPVLRIEAVASILGVTSGTLRSWIKRGWFPAPIGWQPIRTRRMHVYTLEEIETYSRHIADMFPEEIWQPFRDRPELSAELKHIQSLCLKYLIDQNRLQWRAANE
jgi:predicted DNA-binding transcriptional regulator AlpA